jgi:type II secretory pathway component PulK
MENTMKSTYNSRRKQRESGVALLVAIFVLMLVSVIAISLIVASGGESALRATTLLGRRVSCGYRGAGRSARAAAQEERGLL